MPVDRSNGVFQMLLRLYNTTLAAVINNAIKQLRVSCFKISTGCESVLLKSVCLSEENVCFEDSHALLPTSRPDLMNSG